MGAASSRPHEEAEDWEDHFQHEYEQPTAANWAEDEEEEASVSVHLGPRLVRRLQQRQSGGAAARRPQQQQREKQEQQQRFDEAALELDVDEALPPPLSEEELDSIAFSTPLPLLLGDDDVEEEVRHGAGEASTSVVVPARRAGGVSQADREFAQQEVAEVRQRFRAEQEKISATEVEQLHKLRGLLDAMTRHRRASEDSCEAERSACLECYAKETDDPLACAAKARAFKQCATAPVRKGAPVDRKSVV